MLPRLSASALAAVLLVASLLALPPAAVAAPPGVPQQVDAVADDDSTDVTLSWQPPAGSGPVTAYVVTVRAVGSTEVETALPPEARSHTFTGLAPDTDHEVSVRARNGGEDSPSIIEQLRTAGTPGTVADLVATLDAPARTITLTWGDPAYRGASAVTGFDVRLDSGDWVGLGPSTHNHTFTGVSLADHAVWVRARNLQGAGRDVIRPVDAPVPSPPTDVRAVVESSTVVTLHWGPPAEDHGLPVTGYRVRTPGCLTCPPESHWEPVLPATQTSFRFTGLGPGSRATFEVQAITAAGPGRSAGAEATPYGVPSAPVALTAVRAGARLDQVHVTWSAPVDHGGGSRPYVRLDAGPWVPAEGSPNEPIARSHVFEGVGPAAHTVAVRYANHLGEGPPATTEVPALTASSPPVGLYRAVAPWGAVAVGWQPPTSPGPGPLAYRVYLDGAVVAPWVHQGTAAWLPTMAPGSTHVAEVTAINGTGVDSERAAITVTAPGPPVGPPAPPWIGRAAPGAAGGTLTATARWRPPTLTNGAPVTAYQVYARRLGDGGRVVATRTSRTLGAGLRSVSMTLSRGRWSFQVRARNAAGWSGLSPRSNVVLPR